MVRGCLRNSNQIVSKFAAAYTKPQISTTFVFIVDVKGNIVESCVGIRSCARYFGLTKHLQALPARPRQSTRGREAIICSYSYAASSALSESRRHIGSD